MAQRRSLLSPSTPEHRRTSASRILLTALLALGCSADEVTGPRTAAEPPPHDPMRVVNLVVTDTQLHTLTRHHFTYDDAGRLKRVDFYISQVAGGPPVWNTYYATHTYVGDLLAETNYYRIADTGKYVNYGRINYAYDRLGYLVRETGRRARRTDRPGDPAPGIVEKFITTFRYDRQGRLAERLQDNGERVIYSYHADGTLAAAEYRSPDAQTQRRTFSYAGGRNPFYRRVAHVNSLILPIGLETTLLSPVNLARLENRVDPDPTLIASLTHEYRTDGEGRPLHIRERFINDIHPESQGTVLLFDFDYEPAGG